MGPIDTEPIASKDAAAQGIPGPPSVPPRKAGGRPHQSFYAKHEAVILGSLSVILIIGVWQAAWSAGMISPLFFSSPTAIVKQFRYTLVEGTLLADMRYSYTNFAIGFTIATITGVVFGVLIGWYRRLRLFFDPFLNALYATPRVAMVPLIIIWFGIGIWSKVFIVFLSAFFPILVNTVGGVRALDRDLLRAAKPSRTGRSLPKSLISSSATRI